MLAAVLSGMDRLSGMGSLPHDSAATRWRASAPRSRLGSQRASGKRAIAGRSARSRGLAEAHELAAFLIPERQSHALEAGPERQPLGPAQLRVLLEAGAQAIVRDFA